jgi:hypothetical protein
MLRALEPDVAIVGVETLGDGVLALSVLRAVQAAPRQQAGEIRDADAEHLLGQDVIDALHKVRHLVAQSLGQAAGDLAQEHARLGARIEKLHRLVGPNIRAIVVGRPRLSHSIQHPVRKLRGREHLVVREVGDARQHIRVAPAQRKTSLRAHAASFGVAPCAAASSLTVIGG